MRIGIVGRTEALLKTARALKGAGHEIAFIFTCRSEEFYSVKEEDFSSYAQDIGVPFYNSLKLTGNLDEIKKLNADICVSMNWLNLIPQEFLDAFPLGVLNAHAGDLPRYKGNACPNWAILNGEKEICACIHRMTVDLDGGPILLKKFLPIDDNVYIEEIYDWLFKIIPEAYVEGITKLDNKEIDFQEQDSSIRTLRVYPRKPSDSQIHWNNNADDILKLIRASSHPFAGAYCNLEDTRKVIVYKARVYNPNYDFMAVPGQVCESRNGNPVIATGKGMIEITECCIEGLSHKESSTIVTKSLRNRLL